MTFKVKKPRRPLYIILPSTVEPPSDMPFLTLRSAGKRFDQTKTALKYWSRQMKKGHFDLTIVVSDNSGWADRIFKETHHLFDSGRLICLDAPKPSMDMILKGKGAGETSSILHALDSLNIPDGALIAKMTARQYCRNAMGLLARLQPDSTFAAYPRPQLDSVDSRFYAATPGFLKKTLPLILEETDDNLGIFVENLYAKYGIWANQGDFEIFAHEPAIVGQAGTTGTKLSNLSEANIIALVVNFRAFLRRSLPFIAPKYSRK